MIPYRIFIVEDEQVVAEDLKDMLEKLGYRVVGTAANGEDAIREVERARPHLVLMDIRIQGSMDGIETAEQIYAQFEIPVCYLTAYADEATLERAKSTLPFGYVLKPFEERNVRTAIELALYRHEMDQMLRSMTDWHATTLRDLGEAVVAEDSQGRLMYMNRAAEALMRCPLHEVLGKPIKTIFSFRQENGRTRVTLPSQSAPMIGVRTSLGKEGGAVWVLKTAEVPEVSAG